MNGDEFLSALVRIVGADNASAYASRFGDLEADFLNGMRAYEALAFFVYSTGLLWHARINRELWHGPVSREIEVFAEVLNSGLSKLPPSRLKDGLAYRGYHTEDLPAFAERYAAGSIVTFLGFTSAVENVENAYFGNVLFRIRARNARQIWFLGSDYLRDELLFPSGCQFRVVATIQLAVQRLMIVIDEV